VISYSVKDGIFKKIAIEALFSKLDLSDVKLDDAWQKAIKTNNAIANKKITDGTTFDSNDRDHKKLIVAIHKMSDFKKDKGKPYVLIIDEINRGNTSRIFGELITLIESTKRAGSVDEAMDAILPYSQETFTVPDNLYIIGTMNTADRSLALIDTALRRRFDFIEKMPDVKLIQHNDKALKIGDIDIQKMLQTINDRIEVLYDREHTIGHAFFMKLTGNSDITDLASVFRRNILPLLEEYFFEDWNKISQVLGKSDIYTVKDSVPGLSTGNNYSRNEKSLAIPETYINIYKDTDLTQRDSTGSS
jgi:5-methylcytosine-specific restriction endonuclease McrBC GTP-binding regulatory subunit McrB